MKKNLIILGDSFCHGIGTISTVMDKRNTEFAFGKFLSQHFDLTYVNLAEPGSSVGRIVETGFKYLQNNYQNGDLVIIGWTSPLRLNVVDKDMALQILPEFVWLGQISQTDLAVDSSGVKCVTDMPNQGYLSALSMIHKAFVQNNLFEGLENQAYIQAITFKSWLNENCIEYRDFSVFGDKKYNPKLSISFRDVMTDQKRHPTIDEQKLFSEMLLKIL